MHSNNRFHPYIKECVERTREDGSIPLDLIRSADLRLGNLCNLACRMCSPLATKKIIPEYRIICNDPNAFKTEENVDWFESDGFWSDLENHFKNIERVHLAGGEPFIIKKGVQFLEKLIEDGISKNILLTYNTNLTVIPQAFYNLWPHFKGVIITISLDGVGAVNDYIRWPSQWKMIDKNICQLENDWEKLNVTAASVHGVVTAYNATRLTDLCEYCKSFKKIIPYPILDYVYSVDFCDARILPMEKKILAVGRIDEYMSHLRKIDETDYGDERRNLRNQLQGIAKFLMTEGPEDGLNKFRWHTSIFDRYREQYLNDYIPELGDLMEGWD